MPLDSLAGRGVEPDFADQHDAARQAGLAVGLIDHDALVAGEVRRAVRRVRGSGPAILRSWMLTPAQYAQLHGALAERGVALCTSPAAYAACHHLPGWYDQLRGHTPESVWVPGHPPAMADCLTALRRLPAGGAVVKDYVKSWKHRWEEACFIPDVRDEGHAASVIAAMLRLQGEDLRGGVVLRALAPLAVVDRHPDSGMPLAEEVRTFVFRGTPLVSAPYWSGVATTLPPPGSLDPVLEQIDSPLYTVDQARLTDGSWTVIEVGDGQVSGLQGILPGEFYTRLAAACAG